MGDGRNQIYFCECGSLATLVDMNPLCAPCALDYIKQLRGGINEAYGEMRKLRERDALRKLLQDVVDHHQKWGGDEWGQGIVDRECLDKRLKDAGIE